MDAGKLRQTIEEYTSNLLQKNEDLFLVDVKVKPGNNIKIFIDGDNGVTIDTCTQINRVLYREIEKNGLFPGGDFSLEVSSPGVDEPLKLFRQYKKNIGRRVEVVLNDESRKEGKLSEVNADEIIIEETDDKTKKKKDRNIVPQRTNILFNQIKQTKVLITF
jgi:ribosome maturation factor RimP